MPMRIVTINVPNAYIRAFKDLVDGGLYNNRSEIVREALKEFLGREKVLTSDLRQDNFKEIMGIKELVIA